MLNFNKEPVVCSIGNYRIGGRPGENPPLLIGNIFQKGDIMLESRREGKFNRSGTTERIKAVEQISVETGIPAMIAIVANSADEMKRYIDYYIEVTSLPFAIDIWMENVRMEAVRYAAGLGVQDRLLYNSITPWDKDPEGQIAELNELGIRHIVVQVFDEQDKRSFGRLNSLKILLPLIEKGRFDSVLVDTSIMNLPTTSLSLKANYLIKQQFGLPVGFAPSNGSYLYRKAAGEQGKAYFAAVDAGAHAISALLCDFILFGPLSGIQRVFPAVAAAHSMMAALAFEDRGYIASSDHPLALMFPEVLEQFIRERKEKL